MTKKTIAKQAYLYLTWEDTGKLLLQLAEQILAKNKKYDRIIALAKGGLTWSRALADYIGVENLSSIQIQFYTGIAETAKTPVITQSLPVSIRNEHVLVFDDVADSGETLLLAKKYLMMHGATSVDTATLTTKTWTKVQPDFSTISSSEWIVFPHEIRETIQILKKKWTAEGLKETAIRANLEKIGIAKREIEIYYKLV